MPERQRDERWSWASPYPPAVLCDDVECVRGGRGVTAFTMREECRRTSGCAATAQQRRPPHSPAPHDGWTKKPRCLPFVSPS